MRALALVGMLLGAAACSSGSPRVGSPSAAAPGPLAVSHAALGCESCHVGTTGEVASAKCIDCHDHATLGKRLAANRGYHATAGVRGLACQACHRDHQGRSFDMRGWQAVPGGEAGFDHDLAGWPLRDPHVTSCERCHPTVDRQGRRRYAGADRTCSTCHVTHPKFELGAHRTQPCESCHTPALGAAMPESVCHECHVDDSPHGTRFEMFGPPACGACHRTTSWRIVAFNHDLQTRFPLSGGHDDVSCRACHRGSSPDEFERFKRGLGCKGCHAHARVHADEDHPNGQYTSRQCRLCHVRPGY